MGPAIGPGLVPGPSGSPGPVARPMPAPGAQTTLERPL